MEPATIWRDYAHLTFYPILAGTALLVLAGFVRELLGRWFHG